MASASTVRTARHLHLVRAAQSAGEAFAYAPQDDRGEARSGSVAAMAAFVVTLTFAATTALYLVF